MLLFVVLVLSEGLKHLVKGAILIVQSVFKLVEMNKEGLFVKSVALKPSTSANLIEITKMEITQMMIPKTMQHSVLTVTD